MPEHAPSSPESPDQKLVAAIMKKADGLKKAYVFPNNVWEAIKQVGIKDEAGKAKFRKLVMAEYGRRGSRARARGRAQGDQAPRHLEQEGVSANRPTRMSRLEQLRELEEIKRARMIEEARELAKLDPIEEEDED